MKKLSKDILIVCMSIFALAQSLFIYSASNANKSKVCIDETMVNNYRSLSQFNKELNYLQEKSIIGANEIDGKWYIKLKIEGNKEYILNELYNLKAYDINDYIINHNNDENNLIIEITDSARV